MTYPAPAHNFQKGTSLIETLLYIALMGMLIAGGIAGSFFVIDASTKDKADIITQAEGNFILRKLNWALTGATSVTVTTTSLGVTKSTGTKQFALDGSFLEEDGLALNSSSAKISGLTFVKIDAAGARPAAVTADLSINGKTFTMTKYLRQ